MKNFIIKNSLYWYLSPYTHEAHGLMWEEGGNEKESKSKGSVRGYKGKEHDTEEQSGRNVL